MRVWVLWKTFRLLLCQVMPCRCDATHRIWANDSPAINSNNCNCPNIGGLQMHFTTTQCNNSLEAQIWSDKEFCRKKVAKSFQRATNHVCPGTAKHFRKSKTCNLPPGVPTQAMEYNSSHSNPINDSEIVSKLKICNKKRCKLWFSWSCVLYPMKRPNASLLVKK